MPAAAIMLLGTSSSVGKSVLAAGFCRFFSRQGLKVIPFKAQNMSSSSKVFENGDEMAVAQFLQAEAAGIEASPDMNPILLKPRGDQRSEVFLLGKKQEESSAIQYYREKARYWPEVRAAYERLAAQADIMVVEGAGSAAEINLQDGDFVNLGLAQRLRIPCLLIGDIDRGGVFASLYGTLALNCPENRERIKALIINKFRGDIRLLEPGLKQLEGLCERPVLGTLPMLDFKLDEEDSLSAASGRGADFHADREEREKAYDTLAAAIEEHLNIPLLEEIIKEG